MNDSPAPGALSDKSVVQMANAIRALAMDAVQKANSGHPGMRGSGAFQYVELDSMMKVQ